MKALNFRMQAIIAGVAVSTAMAFASQNAFAATAKKSKKKAAAAAAATPAPTAAPSADVDETAAHVEGVKVPTAVLENQPKEKAAVKNAANREDIDSEVTNARLRASTGAKSLFSFQSAVTWNGGSIKQPFGQNRPVLSPGTIENDPMKITASVSGKYRITDHDNLNIGLGLGWLTPFYDGQKGQAEDPYVSYGRVFKAIGLQNVFSASVMAYTTDSSRARQDVMETDINHTILWEVPHSRWQLGLNVDWSHEVYSGKAVTSGPTAKNPGDRLLDSIAAYPFAEYAFNDTYSFRTVYRGITYYNSLASTNTFVRDAPTQSLGVGIAITRDIYLYPNLQWVWEDIRADKTDVAISANINL